MTDELRQQPQSLEAEQAVLGSILLDNTVLPTVQGILRESSAFYDAGHRAIYDAILALDASGSSIDPALVCEKLKVSGRLDLVGGSAYVYSLESAVLASSLAGDHAKIILEKSARRRLIDTMNGFAERVWAEEDKSAQTINLEAQKDLSSQVSNSDSLWLTSRQAAQDAGDLLDKILEGQATPAFRTGIPWLDGITGGLEPQDMIVIAGRPGTGKTSLAMQIFLHGAVAYQKHVVFFSLEMGHRQVVQRMVAQITGISMRDQREARRLDSTAINAIRDAHRIIGSKSIIIDATPGIGIELLTARARAYQQKLMNDGASISLIVVDYFGLMSATPSNRFDDKLSVLERTSHGIKNLAKELDVPVILCGQLNRENMKYDGKNSPPYPHHIRSCDAVAHDADGIIMLHDPFEKKELIPDNIREWILRARNKGEFWTDIEDSVKVIQMFMRKQRNGQTGDWQFMFDGIGTTFDELPKELPED